MEQEQKTLRICTIVVIGALLVRLISGSFWENSVRALGSPEASSVFLFLETGRLIRVETPVEDPVPTTPTETVSIDSHPDLPVFSKSDASLVEIRNSSGHDVQAAALLENALNWDLSGSAPTVLILHTHATEGYSESSNYRTSDTEYNVVSIGDRIAELLENVGIRVIHDRALHDAPSYNNAYTDARNATQQYLEKYPQVRLVLDIHRDSIEDDSGRQIAASVSTEAGDSAQLMMVIGSDAGGQNHPDWEENLALAVKLHTQLEKLCPGICRPVNFRAQRYNQDLSPGALLVEVGAAGNTRQQALLAADYLAQAIISLSQGSTFV